MLRRPARRRLLPLLAGALLLAACRSDPVTGKVYYSPLGNDFESQDRWVRENFIAQEQVARDGGLLPEPGIVAAVGEVFTDVARAVPEEHRRGFTYTLYLSTATGVNAYTYGGGRVHCNLGLIAECEDASELAGVLAHELGHISHDHVGQTMGRTAIRESIFGIGGIFGKTGRAITEGFGDFLTRVPQASYSRAQERESDERAVDYTARAGYDPTGLARFFARQESRGRSESGPAILRSHPSDARRVEAIQRRAAASTDAGSPVLRRDTEAFGKARDRAREILPYYVDLEHALAGEDPLPAIEAARRGTEALPDHPQFWFWLGALREAQGEREAALDALGRAAELDRGNFTVPFVHALVAYDAGDYDAAEASATRTLRILPGLGGAWLLRGLARVGRGDREGAWADFDLLVGAVEKGRRADLLATIRKAAPDYEPPDERAPAAR